MSNSYFGLQILCVLSVHCVHMCLENGKKTNSINSI